MKAASISSHEHVDLSIESFKNAIAKQPIAIGLYANGNFQRYAGGIFEDSSCPQNKANHAVIAVGYNSADEYWTIRNSWGGHWGEVPQRRLHERCRVLGREGRASLRCC